jgi:drug/metabolite transporter (DMT)-like permease
VSRDREGLLLGLIGVTMFSLSLPVTREAVPYFGPVITGVGRAMVAALLAALVLTVRREPFPGRQYLPDLFMIAAGVVVGFPVLTSIALRHLPASHGAVVVGLLPAATAVCAVLMAGEHPPRAFWGAVAFGVVTVLIFAIVQGAGRPQWGDLLLLGAVAAAAMGYAVGGRLSRDLGGWRVISWTLVVAFPFITPVVIWDAAGRTFDAPWQGWMALAYLCIVSMYVGFLFWYRGLAIGGIARVGQVQLAQPVMSLFWAWLLLGESVGWEEILAGGLVISSVVLTRRYREQAPNIHPADPLPYRPENA